MMPSSAGLPLTRRPVIDGCDLVAGRRWASQTGQPTSATAEGCAGSLRRTAPGHHGGGAVLVPHNEGHEGSQERHTGSDHQAQVVSAQVGDQPVAAVIDGADSGQDSDQDGTPIAPPR